jgi:hypothetical protein
MSRTAAAMFIHKTTVLYARAYLAERKLFILKKEKPFL